MIKLMSLLSELEITSGRWVDYNLSELDEEGMKQYLDLSYSRVGQDARYALDDNKLRALGWEPKAVFDEELYTIVNYYRNRFIW